MFQGLRTVIYAAPDLAEAKDWYTKVLGYGPYFDQPFYVGFNVAGYELGLDPAAPEATGHPCNPAVYWGIENADKALAQLIAFGAVAVSPLTDVGDNIRTGLMRDPFGNVFGIIENPHFKLP